MQNWIVWLAVSLALGVAAALMMYEPQPLVVEQEPEPQEPPICKVDNVKIGADGYDVFTDYGAKSYLFIRADGTVDIYEEAKPDRSNCVE